jgi:DNA polymerase I-like protein with 3'-5' exonuclease and polymerase domains
MIAVDCETTGTDVFHGARPFFVTLCTDAGEQTYYEWQVDPFTREVAAPPADLAEIRGVLARAARWGEGFGPDVVERHAVVGQNIKFDAAMLRAAGAVPEGDWPWAVTRDTLFAAHLLASNRPKDLTTLALEYLNVDIEPYELSLKEAVLKCRRQAQQARLRVKRAANKRVGKLPLADMDKLSLEAGEDLFGEDEPLAAWRIAEKGLPEMPSAKEKTWKYDTWIPRAVADFEGLPPNHPYRTVLRDYANADSAATVALWPVMRDEIRRRGLWKHYLRRLAVLPVAARMERDGVTLSGVRLEELTAKYREGSARCGRVCVNLAAGDGHELTLPKNGVNASLRSYCFDTLRLEPVRNPKAKTDAPTLNKGAMDHYLETLRAGSRPLLFLKKLRDKRSMDTALAYLAGYKRFWIPLLYKCQEPGENTDWYRLHPSLNPTGTDTLRWSSSQPNEQNISKKELFNLRYVFGPAPGREWWSLDAKNIELRIPAYECGEQDLIDLFERPDDPPFYGSEHLLTFSVVYPDVWADAVKEVGLDKAGPYCKKKYASTWYQRCKNGDFAVGYGAVDREDGTGTADRTFGRPGSQARLKARFAKKEVLNQKWIRFAEKHGYVETVPDRTVDPRRGYPLLCTRTEYGPVKPTVPLNFHVQGTAMHWTEKAMVRCDGQLKEWRRTGFDGFIAIQQHDELVFDLPAGGDPAEDHRKEKAAKGRPTSRTSNLWRVRTFQRLMEAGGEDLIPRVPTPVGVEYHPNNWSEGVTY